MWQICRVANLAWGKSALWQIWRGANLSWGKSAVGQICRVANLAWGKSIMGHICRVANLPCGKCPVREIFRGANLPRGKSGAGVVGCSRFGALDDIEARSRVLLCVKSWADFCYRRPSPRCRPDRVCPRACRSGAGFVGCSRFGALDHIEAPPPPARAAVCKELGRLLLSAPLVSLSA